MAIDAAKQIIDDALSIDLIDLDGEINTKGNYIYLSGVNVRETIQGEFDFTLCVADKNLSKKDDSIKSTLDIVLKDLLRAKVNGTADLDISRIRLIKQKDADLFMYEIIIRVYLQIDVG